MSYHCPSCGCLAVPPYGNKSSKLLIVGEFPGEVELDKGRPFCGPSGHVLRMELARLGLDMVQFRTINLWLHEPNPKDKKNYDNCFKAGKDLVLENAKEREAILLVGSSAVEEFTNGYTVSHISGLRLDPSDHVFSCKNVMAIVNPAIVFRPSKGIGEVRFGIENFYKMIVEKGIIEE